MSSDRPWLDQARRLDRALAAGRSMDPRLRRDLAVVARLQELPVLRPDPRWREVTYHLVVAEARRRSRPHRVVLVLPWQRLIAAGVLGVLAALVVTAPPGSLFAPVKAWVTDLLDDVQHTRPSSPILRDHQTSNRAPVSPSTSPSAVPSGVVGAVGSSTAGPGAQAGTQAPTAGSTAGGPTAGGASSSSGGDLSGAVSAPSLGSVGSGSDAATSVGGVGGLSVPPVPVPTSVVPSVPTPPERISVTTPPVPTGATVGPCTVTLGVSVGVGCH